MRPLERSRHRPDPSAAAGAAGSPGRRPARLPEAGRPGVLAGGKSLRSYLCFGTVQESVQTRLGGYESAPI